MPDPSTGVNIIDSGLLLESCLAESTFVVPAGKALLVTDVIIEVVSRPDIVALQTDSRGIIHTLGEVGDSRTFQTPLLVNEGEVFCSTRTSGQTDVGLMEPTDVFIAGRVVDAS